MNIETTNITSVDPSCDSYSAQKWDDMNLPTDLLRGIYSYGFERPSPIQCKAIPVIMSGKDVVAQSQSGTGKTAAFTIGALAQIELGLMSPQVLIISPTRELSLQIRGVVDSIGGMMSGLRTQLLVGGEGVDKDMRLLAEKPPHVVIGCTGRIYDMIRRNALKVESLKITIVDEADEMLDGGFIDQLSSIFREFPAETQIALFSATIPQSTLPILDDMMKNPEHLILKREVLTLEGISQYYVAVEDDAQKYAVLKDLYSSLTLSHCIIYCNSIGRVDELTAAMINDGFPACCIHGNMTKESRERAISDFRNGKNRVLISSNVTARGIDIQQVSVVINFDVCKSVHTYLHRIGRSGRWGRKGVGINFVTRRDIGKLRMIEHHYETQIEELPSNFMESLS